MINDDSTVEYIQQLDRDEIHSQINNQLLVFQLIDFNCIKSIKYLAEELEFNLDISKPHGNIVQLGRKDPNSDSIRIVQKVPIIYAINCENYELAYYFHNLNPELTNELLKIKDSNNSYADKIYKHSKVLLGYFKCKNLNQALFKACEYGHLQIVKFLLNQGAKANGGDGNGEPLSVASFEGHYRLVKFLLDHGAHADDGDSKALRWACENGHLEVVKLLLDYGAKVNDYYGKALISAIQYGHLKLVQFLLDNGANVNINNRGDNYYSEALIRAKLLGHNEIVQLLLDNGARNYFEYVVPYNHHNNMQIVYF